MTARLRKPARARITPETARMAATIATITDETVVYEVMLEKGEKPLTVRQRLVRASRIAGVEIAVRASPRGFFVGLMTDARRSNRGRRKADIGTGEPGA